MRQALQILTIFPIPGPNTPAGRSAWAFPAVGVLLGLMAAACLQIGPLGPVLALVVLCLGTGGLHEDGLADVFDALRVGRSREKMHAILKDSRVGTYGALALVASFVWRWQALSLLHGDAWLRLPAAVGLARGAMVLLAAVSEPAGDGLGRSFLSTMPRWAAPVVLVQVLGLAALCRWPAALVLIVGNLAALAVLHRWFHARLGGITGDCLGAAAQVAEALSLGVLTWL